MNLQKGTDKLVRACGIVLLTCMLLSIFGCGQKEKQITEVSELDGKTICAVMGSVNAAPVKQREDLSEAKIVYATSNSNALAMLLVGKADAFVSDYVIAQTLHGKYSSVTVIDEMLDEAYYGIAFPKGSALCDEFSLVIDRLKNDGTVEYLIEKWMGGDPELKSVSEQAWEAENGTLKCCVNPDAEPLCYKKDGQLLGFDVELIQIIAEELGYGVEFHENEFDDLLPSVSAGQADFAVSAITITDERKENVDFSEGYLDAGTVLMVRNVEAGTSRDGIILSVKNSFQRVFVENDRWLDMLRGLGMTLLISVLSAFTGCIFGAGIFLWDYAGNKAVHKVLGIVSRILSLLPLSTFLLIIYYAVFAGSSGSGFWASIVAFTFTFGFDVYGNLSGAVGSLSVGQSEAAFSMGYRRYQALFKIFIPQAMPKFLGGMQGSVIGHIRGTALVEFIAVQDFQAVADVIRAETAEPFLPVILPAVIYVLLASLASRLVGRIKVNTNPAEKTEEEIRDRAMKGKL